MSGASSMMCPSPAPSSQAKRIVAMAYPVRKRIRGWKVEDGRWRKEEGARRSHARADQLALGGASSLSGALTNLGRSYARPPSQQLLRPRQHRLPLLLPVERGVTLCERAGGAGVTLQ